MPKITFWIRKRKTWVIRVPVISIKIQTIFVEQTFLNLHLSFACFKESKFYVRKQFKCLLGTCRLYRSIRVLSGENQNLKIGGAVARG